ncbi:hypothetical protein [Thiolapillus sp.]|uniref:hypothetical protein n=1 Tax=Thiolapillus sp. TaxID=2017437 RepID=UPI003AF466B5
MGFYAKLKQNHASNQRYIKLDDTIPVDGVIQPKWRDIVIEDNQGEKRINRINYEICVLQACLRPRDRFWDIPVPKIDSAFDNLFVPQPSWSPSTTQQLRKLVAAPYWAPI